MNNLTQNEQKALKELEEDKKAALREIVMLRIEKRREAERNTKSKVYTQERLEAEEKALKSIKRWLRRHNKKQLDLKRVFRALNRSI